MGKPPWRPRVTVAAIVQQQQRFLLVEETVAGRRVWNQPAGHLEDGEDLLTAIRREVREETCRHFEPDGVTGIYRWRAPDSGETYLRFCFTGRVSAFDSALARDPDILRDRWMTANEIASEPDRLRSPLVLLAVTDAGRRPAVALDLLRDLG